GSGFDGGTYLAYDARDADIGTQGVGRHRHRMAVRQRSGSEVRPEALVEAQPEAAMDEDDEPLGRSLRQVEIKAVPGSSPIGDVGPPASLCFKPCAERR